LTNKLDIAELRLDRFLPRQPARMPTRVTFQQRRLILRATLTPGPTLSISPPITTRACGILARKPHNDLASLPTGLQTFAGVEYDVRGIVQLAGTSLTKKTFPPRVDGIKIQQKCAQIHFLDAVAYATKEGQAVGSYIVHFAVNQMQLEIPLIYGHELRDWHKYKEEEPSPS